MLEHSYDYHAIRLSERSSAPKGDAIPRVPVYKMEDKYYILGEYAIFRMERDCIAKIGSSGPASHLHYQYSRGPVAYYEVEQENHLGHTSYILKGGELPLTTLPPPCQSPIGTYRIDLPMADAHLSWRALYGIPTTGILCVAVDFPFTLISFTGFCISSLFD